MTAGDGDVVDLEKAREDRKDRAIEELARKVRELAGQVKAENEDAEDR